MKGCKHKWENVSSVERGSGIDGAKQPPDQQKEVSRCSRCGAVKTTIYGSNDDFRHTMFQVSSRIRH